MATTVAATQAAATEHPDPGCWLAVQQSRRGERTRDHQQHQRPAPRPQAQARVAGSMASPRAVGRQQGGQVRGQEGGRGDEHHAGTPSPERDRSTTQDHQADPAGSGSRARRRPDPPGDHRHHQPPGRPVPGRVRRQQATTGPSEHDRPQQDLGARHQRPTTRAGGPGGQAAASPRRACPVRATGPPGSRVPSRSSTSERPGGASARPGRPGGASTVRRPIAGWASGGSVSTTSTATRAGSGRRTCRSGRPGTGENTTTTRLPGHAELERRRVGSRPRRPAARASRSWIRRRRRGAGVPPARACAHVTRSATRSPVRTWCFGDAAARTVRIHAAGRTSASP